jgi:hypothetical protein
MPKQKSRKSRKSKRRRKPRKPEVSLQRPERGGYKARDAWILLLRRRLFEPEIGKYVIGERDNPPDWKAFWEKFIEGT